MLDQASLAVTESPDDEELCDSSLEPESLSVAERCAALAERAARRLRSIGDDIAADGAIYAANCIRIAYRISGVDD